MDEITPSQFAELPDLADWRSIVQRIEATFVAPSLAVAAAFVTRVIEASDAADHHPDVNLRYPGRVHVVLTTHATGGLTQLDIDLARAISALAKEAGIVSEPITATGVEIGIDAMDIDAILPFWRAALGYVNDRPWNGKVYGIHDPRRIGPPVWFQQMEEPRLERNNIHIDVIVPHDIAEQRIAAAIAAGGVLRNDGFARAFWVLADAEGNELCICTWQDRD